MGETRRGRKPSLGGVNTLSEEVFPPVTHIEYVKLFFATTQLVRHRCVLRRCCNDK